MKVKELSVEPCIVSDVRGFIEKNHYSKSINGVKITQCFRVEHDGELVGAVLFGQMSTTAWRKFGDKEGDVLELRRLVLIDECPRNSESYTIGCCLRWIKRKLPEVKVVVSYSDPMYGHTGVIYRASNFQFIGVTPDDKGFRDLESGKVYHSRALRTKYKGEYKPFVKRLRYKLENGGLEEIVLKGKNCFIYKLI